MTRVSRRKISPPGLVISIEDDRWQSALPEIEDLSHKALAALFASSDLPPLPPGCDEISLVLTNDAEIRDLNRDYRGKDKATNVLSFPQIDWGNRMAAPLPADSLGDVVIALETMQNEALEQEKPLPHHYQHMLIHGTLHLLGYDHEADSEAKIMENLEIRILSDLKIPNPYVIE